MSDMLMTVPLSKLQRSVSNVRTIESEADIEDLAANISALGILQNLIVKPVSSPNGEPNGKYEVIAGGQRLAALILLAKRRRIGKNFPVPCRLLADNDETEVSLAENVFRAPLHPADQFDAFSKLHAKGQGIEDIAARFGVTPNPANAESISVVSFNIQFLGQFKERDNKGLADLLAPHDLVFVQELVAPPYAGKFPDGSPYKPDAEATAFFEEMRTRGFLYALSEEDTGSGPKIHLNSSATEWYVAFYKPAKVRPAQNLKGGFLAADRSDHPDYERVPYAFPFRSGAADLIFISVHLQPGGSRTERERRAHELKSIGSWIKGRPGKEKDYVVLGDMNIEDCDELGTVLPTDYRSLNGTCKSTNTNINGPKPYDHVMYHSRYSAREIEASAGLTVINLIEAMRGNWPTGAGPYPGDPYDHDAFRTRFSDHHPVVFRIRTEGPDDD